MVTIPTGTWVDNNVDAVELRRSLGAATVIPAGPTAPRPGRLAGPGTPLKVTPTAPASRAVLVSAGKGVTYRSAAYGPILGLGPDGDVVIPMPAAPATGSVWRRVYLLQRDATPPATDADSVAVVDVISGDAAASAPVKPPLPPGALLLGEVLDTAGAATITAGMVTDLPTWTAPRGGVLPVRDQAERVALQTAGLGYPGLEVLELDTARRLWHDGTRFRYEGDRVDVTNTAARAALETVAYPGLEVVQRDTMAAYLWTGIRWATRNASGRSNARPDNTVIAPGGTYGWRMGTGRVPGIGSRLLLHLSVGVIFASPAQQTAQLQLAGSTGLTILENDLDLIERIAGAPGGGAEHRTVVRKVEAEATALTWTLDTRMIVGTGASNVGIANPRCFALAALTQAEAG